MSSRIRTSASALAVFSSSFGISILISENCRAVSLAAGENTTLAGTTEAARPELAGSVIDQIVIPIELTNGEDVTFRGSLINQVVRETVAGTLNFYYRIESTTNDPLHIGYVSVDMFAPGEFADHSIDMDFISDSDGQVAPTGAVYLGAEQPSDDGDLYFDSFEPVYELNNGETTKWFFVRTDATQYSLAASLYIDALVGDDVPAFGNYTTFQPVPEPSSLLAVAAIGAGCLGTRNIRRGFRRQPAAG